MTFDFLANNFDDNLDVHELYFHLLDYSAPIFHGNSAFVAQVALQKFDGNMDLVKYLVQTYSATMIKDFWKRVTLEDVNKAFDKWGIRDPNKWKPSHLAYIDFICSYLVSSEAMSISSLAAHRMQLVGLLARLFYPNPKWISLPKEVHDHYDSLKDQQVCRFLPIEMLSKFHNQKKLECNESSHHDLSLEFHSLTSVRTAIRHHMVAEGDDIPLYPKWFLYGVISHQDFVMDPFDLPDWVPLLSIGRMP